MPGSLHPSRIDHLLSSEMCIKAMKTNAYVIIVFHRGGII